MQTLTPTFMLLSSNRALAEAWRMSEGTVKDLAVPQGSDVLRKCPLCRGSVGGDLGGGPMSENAVGTVGAL